MQKMKAYVRTKPQNMNVELAKIPVPEINDDEVLVKVHAFGVGIHDRYFIPNNATFPYPIGTEAAGVIIKTGGNVTRYQVGERVIFVSLLQAKGGCWAEYVAVSHNNLITMPADMAFTEGAAIPIAGDAALESMRSLNLQAEDTLFVAGSSGAIGTLVIQLATARGIRVAGSASPQNHEYMLFLGAETAVNYADPSWKRLIKQWQPGGVSAALAIQPGTIEDSMDVVKNGGKVVAVSGDQAPSRRNIVVTHIEHHPETRQRLARLVSEIAAGRIQLVIERVYPFKQAVDALEKTETRHARGKIVVRLTGQ